jgi:carboxynorspermidine decarboxylase
MCQQGSDVLERTVAAFEAKFGEFLPRMKWVNFGGGHHITRPGYDLDRLVRVITGFRARWGEHLQVYLEPGEAIGIGTGVLVGTVLDLVHNGVDIAILDLSATAHMPDCLEMPYRPRIFGAGLPGEFPHEYKMGGMSCLAGDVLAGFSFPEPLQVGQRLAQEHARRGVVRRGARGRDRGRPALVGLDPRPRGHGLHSPVRCQRDSDGG